MASRYSLMDQELVELFGKEEGLCQHCHDEQATTILHDYSCCAYTKSYLRSCGACVESAVCKSCARKAQEARKKKNAEAGRVRLHSRPKFSEDETCSVANCQEKLYLQNLKTDRTLCAKHRRITSMYSLADEQLVELYSRFDGKCHICKARNATQLDHDEKCCPPSRGHKRSCGKCVRGALCKSCVWGLGYFKKDPGLLESAQSFLTKLDSPTKTGSSDAAVENGEKATNEAVEKATVENRD